MKFIKFAEYYWEVTKIEEGKLTAIKANIIKSREKRAKIIQPADKHKLVEADNYTDLDWRDTSVLNNHSKSGWLSPEGRLFGCGFHSHEQQAIYVHKKSKEPWGSSR